MAARILDYGTRKRFRWVILPFLSLGLAAVGVVWGAATFFVVVGNEYDERFTPDAGLTAAIQADARTNAMFLSALFIVLLGGLGTGAVSMARSGRYGRFACLCAVIGMAICATPFVLIALERILRIANGR